MRPFDPSGRSRKVRYVLTLLPTLVLLSVTDASSQSHIQLRGCRGNSPGDVMVSVGALCVDKYEASVWSNPDGTGTQYPESDPRFPATFPVDGNWTEPLYAVSKPGVYPARFLTWFQAQQACALSGKRLLTNAEWQMAAAGTPDPGSAGDGVTTCNTNTVGPLPTGSSANCVSRWGVSDMVGNVSEWVADWLPGPGVSVTGADDFTVDGLPAALVRGGLWSAREGGGVFTIWAQHTPSSLNNGTGFRCAR